MNEFFTRPRMMRTARYAAYGLGAFVALVVAAALILPGLLDLPAVERELQAKLSGVAQGQVAWEKLSIRLLPSPRGTLSKVTAEIPGVANVRAEQLDAHLRLLPLLRGRAEIASVSLSKPAIRVHISPPQAAREESREEVPSDPVESYRAVVAAIRGLAPEAVLDVEEGDVEVGLPDMPPIRVRRLALHGRTDSQGIELELTAASDAWSRLKVTTDVDFGDGSGAAKVEVAGLKAQPWLDRLLASSPVGIALPDASLRAEARTDGKTRIECDFQLSAGLVEILQAAGRAQIPGVEARGRVDASKEEITVRLSGAQLGASKVGEGSLQYGLKSGSLESVADFDLDLAQAMDATRRLLPEDAGKALVQFHPVSGRAQGQVKFEMRRSAWNAVVDIRKSDSSVGIEGLPGPVKVAAARVSANDEEITVRLSGAQMGASRLGEGSLRYGLKDGSLATAADFDLDLAQAMDATRRLLPEETAKSLAPIQLVSGRARGQARFEMRRSAWNASVDIRESDSSVGVEGLPGPVKVAAAKVTVTGDAVRIENANLAMLDARARTSATISYGKQLQIEGVISEGSVGENLLAWVWKTADAPPQLALKTPIAVAVQRVAWSRKQPLGVTGAAVSFDGGPAVAVDLDWTPEVLDIRRATIKDARSDAQIVLHLEKRLLQGRFTGSLQSASIGSMLRRAKVPEGGLSGDLRSRFDLDHPERFSATGKLAGASVDLEWLLARPVTIERFDVQADGQKLRIRQASVNWAKQRFTLRGEVTRAADGAPIIDAQIDSPGVVVEALLRRAEAKAPAAEEKKAKPKDDEALWTEWPLPLRGRIAFQSKFVQYGERRAEPVSATLTLEEQRAFMELQQVQLCGISFPLTAEAKREGLAIAVRLAAQKQQLEQTAQCLTERGVQIDGEFDLSADLRTKGRVPELLSNLEGTVDAEARNGIVRKFAMLGNILTTQAVSEMFDPNGPKVDERGFPYRSITAKGRFKKGSFILDESFFRSDIIGIAASGSISLIGAETRPYDSRLTVLVAPLGRLDRMVRRIPVLGYLLGGTLTSVPVAVTGDVRDPRVVLLGPGAVLDVVAGIFERTLKLPAHVLQRSPQSPSP